MQMHFQKALKGDLPSEQRDTTKDLAPVSKHSLRYLPQHLVHALYILRHMKSRDHKMKLLYNLNYYRAIQKRLMLDLREFGTRERIAGDQIHVSIPPTESSKVAANNTTPSFSNDYGAGSKLTSGLTGTDFVVFPEETKDKGEENKNLIDMKMLKFKGKFNNQTFSTCPTMPRFHSTFGESVEHQPLNLERERVSGDTVHANDQSVRLMGRIDHIEIDEKT